MKTPIPSVRSPCWQKRRPVSRPYVLKLSLNQLGQVGAAVVRKW